MIRLREDHVTGRIENDLVHTRGGVRGLDRARENAQGLDPATGGDVRVLDHERDVNDLVLGAGHLAAVRPALLAPETGTVEEVAHETAAPIPNVQAVELLRLRATTDLKWNVKLMVTGNPALDRGSAKRNYSVNLSTLIFPFPLTCN